VSGVIGEVEIPSVEPRRSRAGLVLGVLLLVGAGLVGGIWISRATSQNEDERRDAHLQAFRKLVVKQHQTLAAPDTDASASTTADQGAALPSKPRRPPIEARVVRRQQPRICHLRVSGGPRGATVFIDGQRRGKLPLSAPLAAPAGAPFKIKVSRPDMDPFLRRLTCYPGQRLVLNLGLTPTR
jgi:hypothetical protein